MTLASLGVMLNTGPVAKAVADLDKLTSAAVKAEAGAKALSAPTTAAASATKQLGAAAATTATQVMAATNAVKANNAALAVTGQLTGAAQQQMRNLAFQFQDVATMLISGQAPFMLLAQQLPQITMYGGQLTGVMGALKSTVAGLFSPLGLLTTGFVLAGSAAVSYFSDASDAADEAADALAEQADLIRRVADRWGDAVPEIRAYADELERAIDMSELRKATSETIDARFREAQVDIAELRSALGDLMTDLLRSGETSVEVNRLRDAFNEVNRAAQDLRDAQKSTTATAEDMDRVTRALAELLANDTVRGSDKATEAVNRYAEALREAAKEGAIVAGRQALLDERGGIPLSPYQGGRGGDPRDFEDDPYWRSRYLPDPERPTRPTRTPRRRKTDAERAAERYDDMIRASKQYIEMQRLERDALFMSEEAASALLLKQELLNQAANDNIDLTALSADGERTRGEVLRDLAEDMAAAEAASIKLKEAYDLTKDAAKGVLSSLRKDLMDGDLSFRSFGDSVLSVLDRIIGKLEDEVATAFANAFTPGAPRGGGGLFGSILGGLFGGGGSALGGFNIGNFYAKGGAFGPSGEIHAFAKGGVVDRATVFPFAKGIGLMGEAGPEAIMPLKRGPDGSLGVRAQVAPAANSNGGGQTVKVEQHFHISGAVSSEEIKEAIRQQAAATKADIEGSFAKTFEKNRKAGTV